MFVLTGNMAKAIGCCGVLAASRCARPRPLTPIATPSELGNRSRFCVAKVKGSPYGDPFTLVTLEHSIYKQVAKEIIRWNSIRFLGNFGF